MIAAVPPTFPSAPVVCRPITGCLPLDATSPEYLDTDLHWTWPSIPTPIYSIFINRPTLHGPLVLSSLPTIDPPPHCPFLKYHVNCSKSSVFYLHPYMRYLPKNISIHAHNCNKSRRNFGNLLTRFPHTIHLPRILRHNKWSYIYNPHKTRTS